MNIVKTLDQFKINEIYFCDPIKNNVMSEGSFIRILYSSPIFVMNGVYLIIPLSNLGIEKYYNKYKCTFQLNNHIDLINQIKHVEELIIKKINIPHKIPQFKIYEQLRNGYIKIFTENVDRVNSSFILKISGLWETNNSYGLTYKFMHVLQC